MSDGPALRELLLGIDTGGTYTDAVLFDQRRDVVVATAKSLTTRHDLAVGIGGAVRAVLAEGQRSAGAPSIDSSSVGDRVIDRIGLVSMSTTLATNAIVERHGGAVCLVAIGFSDHELAKAGLPEALAGDPVIALPGGHTSHGEEAAALDLDRLETALAGIGPVAGFAVVGQFGVRNPSHELAVRERLRSLGPTPVTCSHELTAKLNGPKRAVTSVLNARLIGLITSLVEATSTLLQAEGINAPVMVVRGDGSLISEAVAAERPIETILSGPAASVVGARHLTGASAAVVSDIGGTTTDIAVLEDGQPRLSLMGASVGGHHTMVEAVAMHTFGLGGDSEVHIDDRAPVDRVALGPRRVVPLSLLASQYPEVVLPVLEQQVLDHQSRWLSATFAVQVRPDPTPEHRTPIERDLLAGLADGPRALRDLIPTKRHEVQLDRLVGQGIVLRSSFTPTDACHVLGRQHTYDTRAARAGAELLSRVSDRWGVPLGDTAEDAAQLVLDALTLASSRALLSVLLERDGFDASLADHPLVQAGLDRRRATTQPHLGVVVDVRSPIVALGASAATHYPAVAEALGAELVVHEHAGVANAVGAVVGRVRVERQAVITPKGRRAFRTHVGHGPQDFDDLDAAVAHVEATLRTLVSEAVLDGGGVDPALEVHRNDNVASVDGEEVFVDATIAVVGLANPRLG